jgi:hypothetical protein
MLAQRHQQFSGHHTESIPWNLEKPFPSKIGVAKRRISAFSLPPQIGTPTNPNDVNEYPPIQNHLVLDPFVSAMPARCIGGDPPTL